MTVTYPILTLVSESTTPDQVGNNNSILSSGRVLSQNGRYVVFESSATDMVAGDSNAKSDIFVRDLDTGVTTLVSAGLSGAGGDNHSGLASISADGRYVVFSSSANNLVAGDSGDTIDLFVRDMTAGTTTRLTTSGQNTLVSMSGDGQIVIFNREFAGMGETEGLHILNRQTSALVALPEGTADAVLTADGGFAILKQVDLPNSFTMSRYDVSAGTSQTFTLTLPHATYQNTGPDQITVSADGNMIAYEALFLPGGAGNPFVKQVYVTNITTGTTTLVSTSTGGGDGNAFSFAPVISPDGRYVAFFSEATDLVANDTDEMTNIFIRDLVTNTTTMLPDFAYDGPLMEPMSAVGGPGNELPMLSFSGDGAVLAIATPQQLAAGDTGFSYDVFTMRLMESPPINTAPEITSAAAVSISENSSFVIDVTATDAESADNQLQYTISGDDAHLFTLDPTSHEISFIEAPDYEEPLDSDGDNVYNVTLTVMDSGGLTDEQVIAITVTNVNGVTITGTNLANTVNAVTTVAGKSRPTNEEDTIHGLQGDDTLNGLGGNDTIDGDEGNDFITGGDGRDTLIGGAGNDTFIVDADDTITELDGGGIDSVRTLEEAFSLEEIANVEYLWYTGTEDFAGIGNDADNRIWSGAGNDRLDGGVGLDSLYGGAGNDTYVVDQSTDYVSDSLGIDTIETDVSAYVLTTVSNIENLTYTGTGDFTGTGNALANVITGGEGNDVLTGAAGNDTLNGGEGDDRMIGGLGNDFYFVDSASDVVVEGSASGTDTIRTTLATHSLAPLTAVENLVYLGAEDFTGTGNALANRLVGSTGNDTLKGLNGRDTLIGGAGNDILNGGYDRDWLTGGAGDDTFVLKDRVLSLMSDYIQDFVSGEDEIHIENGIFTALGTATGAIDPTKFWSSATGLAHDASDRIIYNTTTGALNYDSNGSAFGGVIQIAILTGKPTLTADDIVII